MGFGLGASSGREVRSGRETGSFGDAAGDERRSRDGDASETFDVGRSFPRDLDGATAAGPVATPLTPEPLPPAVTIDDIRHVLAEALVIQVAAHGRETTSTETAVKLVRRYWQLSGRPDKTIVISRRHAYHGMHVAGTSLSGIPANRQGYGALLSDNVQVP